MEKTGINITLRKDGRYMGKFCIGYYHGFQGNVKLYSGGVWLYLEAFTSTGIELVKLSNAVFANNVSLFDNIYNITPQSVYHFNTFYHL